MSRIRPVMRPAALLLLAAAITAQASSALADLTIKPQARDREVTRMVLQLMDKVHLSRKTADDTMSRRCLRNFMNTLDPRKMYFTKADAAYFARWETELDDDLHKGELGVAYKIFDVFLQRLNNTEHLIDELVKENHDFTVDEVMVSDAEKMDYAANAAEIRDRWRKRIKYEILTTKADDEEMTDEEVREKLIRRYHSLTKRMEQTTSDELLEWFLSAMTQSFDPHSTYMSPSTLDDFEITMRLELDGIGAALTSEDGICKVTEIIPGGAADRAGQLKPDDEITAVAQGDEGEFEDVRDMKLRHVVKLIRGKKGTVVRLRVSPSAGGESKIYKIVRDKINLDDKAARAEIIEEGRKSDNTPFKVGVIDLPSFYMDMSRDRGDNAEYRSTTRDVRRIIDDFKEKGVDAVILDLRRNGGGSLIEAINLTGLFIDKGPVVQVKDGDGRVQAYDDRIPGSVWEGPLVVLQSKLSASASEIFAGAIQDYHRGLIIGDPSSHGKGTVQTLLNLGERLFRGPNAPNLGALKITMQQFYRPSGDSTQMRGVLSDIELPSLTAHLDVGERDLDYAVEFDKVPAASFEPSNQVDPAMIRQLAELSKARRSRNAEFTRDNEKIEAFLERKERKSVPLNEKTYLAERERFNDDEPKEELEKIDASNRPVVERDHYFNEALAITLDYMRLVKVAAR